MGADVMVAVDVGGTGIKAALVGPDGTVRHRHRCPTPDRDGPAAVVETILRVAGELAAAARADGRQPGGVGVVVPGQVDEQRGVLRWAANLGLRDEPLADRLAERVGLPAWLGHDMRAAGTAEARYGAGRGTEHVLFVGLGTGISAAHLVAGRALAGAHGDAGELGHVVVRPGGPRCGCGARGCLEAVASAAAIGRRYAQLAEKLGPAAMTAGSAQLSPLAAGAGPAEASLVAAAVAAGDEVAASVWQEGVAALADGLVIAQALHDVELIVIGGGLAGAGETLLAPLRSAVKERLTFHREPRLVPAALRDEAGCIGAGLLAFDRSAAA